MENRNFMNKYAMQFGTYMGIFWIIKFALFPFAFTIPFFDFLFLVLTVTTPFLGYYFARNYRNRVCDGGISFTHAWIFTSFMYMFAALLTAVGHFIYFRFIDNGYIASSYLEKLHEPVIKQQVVGDTLKQCEEAVNLFSSLRPIEITMELLSFDVIFGALLAFPIAFFVKKKVLVTMKNDQEENNQEEDNKE